MSGEALYVKSSMGKSEFFLAGLDFSGVSSFYGRSVGCWGVRAEGWWQGQLTLRVA